MAILKFIKQLCSQSLYYYGRMVNGHIVAGFDNSTLLYALCFW